MNKAELAEKLNEKFTDLPKAKILEIIEALLQTITETMKAGGEVSLTGFGAFTAKTRKGRTGVNPQTKQAIEIPPVTVPKFKPGKPLKDALKAKAV